MVVTYNKHKAAAHQFLFSREFARSRPCLPTSYVCTYICTLVFIFFFFCFHVFGRDSCVKFFLICSGVRLRERERGSRCWHSPQSLPSSHGDTLPRSRPHHPIRMYIYMQSTQVTRALEEGEHQQQPKKIEHVIL